MLSAAERKACQEQLRARGLALSSFCHPLLDNDPNAPDALMRRYMLDRYKEHIDLVASCKNVYISNSGFDVFKHHGLGKGGGIVDSGPVAEALRDIGYEGYTVLEIITNKVLPESTPDEDFMTSHAILRRHGWADLRR